MVPIITDPQCQRVTSASWLGDVRKTRSRPPLPLRRQGSDQHFKEFGTITFYKESNEHHQLLLSQARRLHAGSLLRREPRDRRFSTPTMGSETWMERLEFLRNWT